jgi:hypothetical protein
MAVTCRFGYWISAWEREPQVRELHMCPRTDTHLTYMINIALSTEFLLTVGTGG